MSGSIQPFDPESPDAFMALLEACGACEPAKVWVGSRRMSMSAACAACDDADWFAWIVGKFRPDVECDRIDVMRASVGSANKFAKHVFMVEGFALTGSGSGYGDGYGSGDGYGYGSGDGSGYGDGYGYGYGSGYGYG